MKKKFYNRFLLVAMLFATAGSYVSCKDYNEEAYSDMLGKNSQLEEVVNEQVDVLDNQIKALEEAQNQYIENNDAWKDVIDQWKTEVESGYVTKDDFKDHVDLYEALLGKNQSEHDNLNEKIAAAETKLNEAITALDSKASKEELIKLNSDLGIAIGNLETKLTGLANDLNVNVANLNSAINENKAKIESAQTDILNLKNRADELDKNLNDAIIAGDKALEEKIKAELDLINDAVGANSKEIQDLKSKFETDLKNAIDANNITLMADIQNKIDILDQAISSKLDNLKDDIKKVTDKLEERVTANEDAIKSLTSTINDLKDEVGKIKDGLNETASKATDAYDLAKINSDKIGILEANYGKLREDLDNLEYLDEADKAELIAKIDSICNELNAAKATADEALALAKENLDKANAYTDERVKLAIDALRNETDLKLADLENAYKNADKELEKRLQDQIDELKASIADVEKRVADNEKKIEELTGKLDKIDKVDESLKQFVSGIILQRAENPVFGSFAFPANIQTNVLMAFYGYAGSYGAQFPTYYPRYYVRAAETLTPKDIQMLGITPETLAEDGDAIVGSAGKVYVTVNPSNVNFEGQTLPIVNSLDEESGVKLTPLKYSDKKLTFGASTRAAVNGFYEAEATLAPEDINKVKMTFDLNVGELKETVKDVINPIDGVNVSQVASTVFDVVSQLNQQLDANALKASWTDELGVSRNIYSNYNLATTAIKPLSYNFMADAHFTSFPGFDKMRNVAGKLMDKIAGKFKIAFNKMPAFDLDIEKISRIQFDNIDINTEDINLDLKVTYKDVIKTTVEIGIDKFVDIDIDHLQNVPSQTFPVEVHVVGDVYDDNGVWVGKYDEFITEIITVPSQDILVSIKDQVPFTWTGEVPVEVPVDIEVPVDASELQKLLNEIEGIEDDVNELLTGQSDKVNKIIDMVNSYLDKLEDLTKLTDKIAEIGSKVDDVNNNLKNKIINFLDKAEGKLLTAVNSINKAVQPVMLVKTAGSFQKLSQTVYSPTVMTAANVQFIPTSYTAELVAPAFKKLVGVTNVYSMNRSKSAQNGDASCLSALKEANAKAGVAEILNGDTQIVNFSAKKGYIYEVTYTSVDFSGFVVAKKYYVTVK